MRLARHACLLCVLTVLMPVTHAEDAKPAAPKPAAPVAQKPAATKPVAAKPVSTTTADDEFLEFLGSVDAEGADEDWLDYLSRTDIEKVAKAKKK